MRSNLAALGRLPERYDDFSAVPLWSMEFEAMLPGNSHEALANLLALKKKSKGRIERKDKCTAQGL